MRDNADHNNGSAPLMAKRLSVYLHRAAFSPVRLPFEVVAGAAVMPHPARGARKEREREGEETVSIRYLGAAAGEGGGEGRGGGGWGGG